MLFGWNILYDGKMDKNIFVASLRSVHLSLPLRKEIEFKK